MPRGLNLKGFYNAFLDFSNNEAKYIKENITDKTDIFIKNLPFDKEIYEYLLKTALNSSNAMPRRRITDMSLSHVDITFDDGETITKYLLGDEFWKTVNSYLAIEEKK